MLASMTSMLKHLSDGKEIRVFPDLSLLDILLHASWRKMITNKMTLKLSFALIEHVTLF